MLLTARGLEFIEDISVISKRENDTTSKKVRGESIKTLQAKSIKENPLRRILSFFQNIQLLSVNKKKLKLNPKPIVTGKNLNLNRELNRINKAFDNQPSKQRVKILKITNYVIKSNCHHFAINATL